MIRRENLHNKHILTAIFASASHPSNIKAKRSKLPSSSGGSGSIITAPVSSTRCGSSSSLLKATLEASSNRSGGIIEDGLKELSGTLSFVDRGSSSLLLSQ